MCFFSRRFFQFAITLIWVIVWLMYHLMFSCNEYFLSASVFQELHPLLGLQGWAKQIWFFFRGVYSSVGNKQIQIWSQLSITVKKGGKQFQREMGRRSHSDRMIPKGILKARHVREANRGRSKKQEGGMATVLKRGQGRQGKGMAGVLC